MRRPRSRNPAIPCCCRPRARAKTCSATTSTAASCSRARRRSCPHEHRRGERTAHARVRPRARLRADRSSRARRDHGRLCVDLDRRPAADRRPVLLSHAPSRRARDRRLRNARRDGDPDGALVSRQLAHARRCVRLADRRARAVAWPRRQRRAALARRRSGHSAGVRARAAVPAACISRATRSGGPTSSPRA